MAARKPKTATREWGVSMTEFKVLKPSTAAAKKMGIHTNSKVYKNGQRGRRSGKNATCPGLYLTLFVVSSVACIDHVTIM